MPDLEIDDSGRRQRDEAMPVPYARAPFEPSLSVGGDTLLECRASAYAGAKAAVFET